MWYDGSSIIPHEGYNPHTLENQSIELTCTICHKVDTGEYLPHLRQLGCMSFLEFMGFVLAVCPLKVWLHHNWPLYAVLNCLEHPFFNSVASYLSIPY